jgi:hypothetical protein
MYRQLSGGPLGQDALLDSLILNARGIWWRGDSGSLLRLSHGVHKGGLARQHRLAHHGSRGRAQEAGGRRECKDNEEGAVQHAEEVEGKVPRSRRVDPNLLDDPKDSSIDSKINPPQSLGM